MTDLCLFHICAAFYRYQLFIRSLQSVCNNGMYAGCKRIVPIDICAVEMIQRIFASAYIQRITIGDKGLSA